MSCNLFIGQRLGNSWKLDISFTTLTSKTTKDKVTKILNTQLSRADVMSSTVSLLLCFAFYQLLLFFQLSDDKLWINVSTILREKKIEEVALAKVGFAVIRAREVIAICSQILNHYYSITVQS